VEGSDKLSSVLCRLSAWSESITGTQGNTDLALDKSTDATMTRIADDLDVVDLGVRREMIVESTYQLSVVHGGGEASNEDAGIVRELWEISVSGGDGAYRLVCQLGCGGGRGRQLCLRDGWGRRDKRVEASAPSSGTGTDELFGHTVLSSVDVDGGGRWESEGDIQVFLLFFQNFSGFGSMSNMARAGFDKVRGRNWTGARLIPTESDHVRRRVRRWRWRRLRLRWPKVRPEDPSLVSTSLRDTLASRRRLLFVTRAHLLRVH